jgi:mannose-6-phosphate isomerase-like protein (cupin superfamily)
MKTVGRLAATLAFAPITVLLPALASATPTYGAEAETFSQTTKDGTDYVIRQITINPGGSTGWHYHPGNTFGIVKEGTLTHYESDCMVDAVYGKDAAVNEPPGPGYVHMGRNLGPTPLVLWVTYVGPAGGPATVDQPDPGCGFA